MLGVLLILTNTLSENYRYLAVDKINSQESQYYYTKEYMEKNVKSALNTQAYIDIIKFRKQKTEDFVKSLREKNLKSIKKIGNKEVKNKIKGDIIALLNSTTMKAFQKAAKLFLLNICFYPNIVNYLNIN